MRNCDSFAIPSRPRQLNFFPFQIVHCLVCFFFLFFSPVVLRHCTDRLTISPLISVGMGGRLARGQQKKEEKPHGGRSPLFLPFLVCTKKKKKIHFYSLLLRELKRSGRGGTGGINTRANVIPRYKSRWVFRLRGKREREQQHPKQQGILLASRGNFPPLCHCRLPYSLLLRLTARIFNLLPRLPPSGNTPNEFCTISSCS